MGQLGKDLPGGRAATGLGEPTWGREGGVGVGVGMSFRCSLEGGAPV